MNVGWSERSACAIGREFTRRCQADMARPDYPVRDHAGPGPVPSDGRPLVIGRLDPDLSAPAARSGGGPFSHSPNGAFPAAGVQQMPRVPLSVVCDGCRSPTLGDVAAWEKRFGCRRADRGAAAVEFALVMPFLLLILFGIIVYGMVFAQALSLSNSARQAARSGVVEGTTCDQIKTLAQDAADTIGMNGADSHVTIKLGASEATSASACGGSYAGSTQPCKTQPAGSNLYVTLTYNPQALVPLVPVPHALSGAGVYRCEFK